jgi:diguanylate cyclase (GGDEF)-like protein
MLTNLYNKRRWEQKINLLKKVYEKTNRIFSIATIDIDFFKDINDKK